MFIKTLDALATYCFLSIFTCTDLEMHAHVMAMVHTPQ